MAKKVKLEESPVVEEVKEESVVASSVEETVVARTVPETFRGSAVMTHIPWGNVVKITTVNGLGYTLPLSEYADWLKGKYQ